MEISPPKTKKELQAFLRIIHYLDKFSPSTAGHLQITKKTHVSQTERTCNATYQKFFMKAKVIIKEEECMKSYDKTKPLYIEIDASGVGQGAAWLQTRSITSCPKDEALDNSILRPIAFASKGLTRAEKRYNNIEGEVSRRHIIWD